MSRINFEDIEPLEKTVYNLIMSIDSLGMGEMGEVEEESKRLIENWIIERKIEVVFKGVIIFPTTDFSLIHNITGIEDNWDLKQFEGKKQWYSYRGYWFSFHTTLELYFLERKWGFQGKKTIEEIKCVIDNICNNE